MADLYQTAIIAEVITEEGLDIVILMVPDE